MKCTECGATQHRGACWTAHDLHAPGRLFCAPCWDLFKMQLCFDKGGPEAIDRDHYGIDPAGRVFAYAPAPPAL